MPELYNQHYINKYSFPKGLICQRKPDEQTKKKQKVSIYDMHTQPMRKGISGWKLTKRALTNPPKAVVNKTRNQANTYQKRQLNDNSNLQMSSMPKYNDTFNVMSNEFLLDSNDMRV